MSENEKPTHKTMWCMPKPRISNMQLKDLAETGQYYDGISDEVLMGIAQELYERRTMAAQAICDWCRLEFYTRDAASLRSRKKRNKSGNVFCSQACACKFGTWKRDYAKKDSQ